MATLPDEVKTYVVQALACFDTPSTVAKAVKAEFGLDVSRQAVEGYDPTKRAGAALGTEMREIFEATRKAFLEDTAQIGVSHRAVRLRTLQRLAERAETQGNLALVATLLEQAAKEVGGALTNRRELTGADGKPIQTEATVRPDLASLDQDERDLVRALLERRAGQSGGGAPGT